MIRSNLFCFGFGVLLLNGYCIAQETTIPRGEHPRPDAMRTHWVNLNGRWQFRFDAQEQGLAEGWEKPGAAGYNQTIVVPFPWESELSGIHQIKGAPKVAWYRRQFKVPADFPASNRVWLRFGAVDWRADVWLNGRKVAEHEGGYTPFEADISEVVDRSGDNVLVVRAYDPTDPALPTGKQVGWYTPSSGIWQTVWLEARPKTYISDFRIVTRIEPAAVHVKAVISGFDRSKYSLELKSDDATVKAASTAGRAPGGERGKREAWRSKLIRQSRTQNSGRRRAPRSTTRRSSSRMPRAAWWTPSPLISGCARSAAAGMASEPYERILLNGKPIYLRAALDQSFNPKGLYTAPDDDFLKRDMIIAKTMGLNGLRIHIKPDEPRRLYWADQIGILILEDMPNTWRQNARARTAWEQTMREALARDRNHPSIITWVAFNETWGLGKPEDYKKDQDTQAWVASMVRLIRELDGHERLVEDNSPCNYDHIAENDLNSWHFYIDNHEKARRHIEEVVAQTKPGSGFNYCPGVAQTNLPLINSEYGSVSAGGGDRDISWGAARLDHSASPAAQDSRIRLHRAHRYRVGAQRAGELRPHSQGIWV